MYIEDIYIYVYIYIYIFVYLGPPPEKEMDAVRTHTLSINPLAFYIQEHS